MAGRSAQSALRFNDCNLFALLFVMVEDGKPYETSIRTLNSNWDRPFIRACLHRLRRQRRWALSHSDTNRFANEHCDIHCHFHDNAYANRYAHADIDRKPNRNTNGNANTYHYANRFAHARPAHGDEKEKGG
jgi:hypothetical protein